MGHRPPADICQQVTKRNVNALRVHAPLEVFSKQVHGFALISLSTNLRDSPHKYSNSPSNDGKKCRMKIQILQSSVFLGFVVALSL